MLFCDIEFVRTNKNFMTTLKISKIERLENSNLLNNLVYCVADLNAAAAGKLMHDDGNFYGVSKIRFLGRLNSNFLKLKKKGYEIIINKAICINPLPGAECIEIRLFPQENIEFEDLSPPKEVEFGSPSREDELVLRFTAEFENGKIKRMLKPISYFEKKKNMFELDFERWN